MENAANAIVVSLARDEPVVLIDTSYYVFYRYFATARWFSFQDRPAVGDDTPAPTAVLGDAAFRAAFIKHMDADIAKLKKTHGLTPDSMNLVFCRDCYRREIWRMDLFPGYKGARIANRTFDPEAFAVVYAHIQALGYPVAWHAQLEADDVAYLVHQRIRAEVDNQIVFITNDHDYLQIKDDRNAIHQMDGKDVYEMGLKKGTCDIELKILKGDKSDNIPAVLTPGQLRRYAALDAAGRVAMLVAMGKLDMYEHNRTLMDWRCLPAALTTSFDANLALAWT
jgi:5'-3' exonuclease